jgi:hypothetical protein
VCVCVFPSLSIFIIVACSFKKEKDFSCHLHSFACIEDLTSLMMNKTENKPINVGFIIIVKIE